MSSVYCLKVNKSNFNFPCSSKVPTYTGSAYTVFMFGQIVCLFCYLPTHITRISKNYNTTLVITELYQNKRVASFVLFLCPFSNAVLNFIKICQMFVMLTCYRYHLRTKDWKCLGQGTVVLWDERFYIFNFDSICT